MILSGMVMALLGVAVGAFGAHGLESILKENDRLATYETGVFYQFVHALALVALGWSRDPKIHKILPSIWIAGTLLFSGSLYALSLTNITKFGAITPLGGLLFMAGWVYAIKRVISSR